MKVLDTFDRIFETYTKLVKIGHSNIKLVVICGRFNSESENI